MRIARRWLPGAAGCLLLGWGCLALAQSAVGALPLRPKIAQTTGLGTVMSARPASRVAPFVTTLGDEPPLLLPLTPSRDAGVPGACGAAADNLCFDYRQGRVVYKPARKLMPEISGMRRESLSVKRDKITLNYSFK